MASFIVVLMMEEKMKKKRNRVLRRTLRDASDPFDLPEREFINIYRLPKETTKFLIVTIENIIQNDGRRSDAIPAELKVSTCLSFTLAIM